MQSKTGRLLRTKIESDYTLPAKGCHVIFTTDVQLRSLELYAAAAR
jgi:hypothetical protein